MPINKSKHSSNFSLIEICILCTPPLWSVVAFAYAHAVFARCWAEKAKRRSSPALASEMNSYTSDLLVSAICRGRFRK